MNKKKMVIVGAGFGGMYAYKSLSKKFRKAHDITIIDKTNHFLFTPLLHEVATGSLETFHVVEPIRSLIDTDTHFLQTEVLSVDTDKKEVATKHGSVVYDILVSALGARTCFFNVPGAAEHSLILKTLADAVLIKNTFIEKFEAASRELDDTKRQQLLSFVIVGSGPTGVELAGEAADLFFDTFEKYYEHLYCPDDVSLRLISSSEVILKAYQTKLQNYAETVLLKHNVHIIKKVRVQEVKEDRVLCSNGDEIMTDTVIWTGGVTPNVLEDTADNIFFKHNKIVVNEYMQVKGVSDTYVVGDMSFVDIGDDRGYPMTAQTAKQQGVLVGKNLSAACVGKAARKFIYREKGMLASLGNYSAVADVFGVSLVGPFAWFMWRTIYIGQFISWRKRFRILFDWTINLFTHRDITHI